MNRVPTLLARPRGRVFDAANPGSYSPMDSGVPATGVVGDVPTLGAGDYSLTRTLMVAVRRGSSMWSTVSV
jgi:hypothetical protein